MVSSVRLSPKPLVPPSEMKKYGSLRNKHTNNIRSHSPQIVAVGRDRYHDFLNAAGNNLEALETQLTTIVNHADVEPELVRLF